MRFSRIAAARTLAVHARLDAGHDASPGLGIEEVPRLGLAEFARPDHPQGLLVVRMNLNRQPVGAVEELDEEREMRPEPGGHGRPEQSRSVRGRQLVQRRAGQPSVGDAAGAVADPGFAYRRTARTKCLAAPNAFAQLRFQRQQVLIEICQGRLLTSRKRVHGARAVGVHRQRRWQRSDRRPQRSWV